MTNREFYTNIANGVLTDAEKTFAEEAIAKLDATNAKRKEKTAEGKTKKAEENAPIVAAIHEALTADAQTASQIAAIVGCSHNKVTPLVKGLVADGVAVMTKVKVPGKGEQNGYALAPVDAE